MVVISDVTQQLVDVDFYLHSLGEHQLKGISRPVEVFAVERPGTRRPASRPSVTARPGWSAGTSRGTRCSRRGQSVGDPCGGGARSSSSARRESASRAWLRGARPGRGQRRPGARRGLPALLRQRLAVADRPDARAGPRPSRRGGGPTGSLVSHLTVLGWTRPGSVPSSARSSGSRRPRLPATRAGPERVPRRDPDPRRRVAVRPRGEHPTCSSSRTCTGPTRPRSPSRPASSSGAPAASSRWPRRATSRPSRGQGPSRPRARPSRPAAPRGGWSTTSRRAGPSTATSAPRSSSRPRGSRSSSRS